MNEAMRARYARIANTAQLGHLTAARELLVAEVLDGVAPSPSEDTVLAAADLPGWQVVRWVDRGYAGGWHGFIADCLLADAAEAIMDAAGTVR